MKRRNSRRGFGLGMSTAVALVMVASAFAGLLAAPSAAADPSAMIPEGTLAPTMIPKWVNELTGPPPVYVPTLVTDVDGNVIEEDYSVQMDEVTQQLLPSPLPATPVWGYGGWARDALDPEGTPFFVTHSPGPTFEAERGIPMSVRWINNVDGGYMFPVDTSIHWADVPGFDGTTPVPLVTHVHGAEVQSYSDGGPQEWFTNSGLHGTDYSSLPGAASNEAIYYYPNEQQGTTLWYHDHGLGVTRLNVMSGLAGFYLLRDPAADVVAPLLPSGPYEMPLAIQDRIFYPDGRLWQPTEGINPDLHPFWQPEFFGNTIMVNGLVWPFMNVDQGWYRFRILDGSNARFYTLTFRAQLGAGGPTLPFYQIGSDGGYLRQAAPLTSLTIAPGERADVLINFAGLPAGTQVLLANTAKAPFPMGSPPDPRATGQIVQFRVTGKAGASLNPGVLTMGLNPTLPLTDPFPNLPAPSLTRTRVLWEVEGELGPEMVTLNGQMWDGALSETPTQGATEEWVIVNPTADAHPIHLHLVQFQLVSRQLIDTKKYGSDWLTLQRTTGGLGPDAEPPWPMDFVPLELPIGAYLKGKPMAAPLNEQGWKDTIQMFPGQVTVIRVRWASQDGSPFGFDASQGPGYVWHCHILEHEDNEMMRPYMVLAAPKP